MTIIESIALHAMQRLKETYQRNLEYNKHNLLVDDKDIIEQKLLLVDNYLNQMRIYTKEDT